LIMQCLFICNDNRKEGKERENEEINEKTNLDAPLVSRILLISTTNVMGGKQQGTLVNWGHSENCKHARPLVVLQQSGPGGIVQS